MVYNVLSFILLFLNIKQHQEWNMLKMLFLGFSEQRSVFILFMLRFKIQELQIKKINAHTNLVGYPEQRN